MFCDADIPEKRRACVGSSDCLRCQSAGSAAPGGLTHLLLGPGNSNVHRAVVKALQSANLHYQERGVVLAVPVQRPFISELPPAFLAHLSAATAADVKAVFFSGDLCDAVGALSAFVRAEPLASLLALAPYEWVRDALDDNWLFSVFHPIVEADGSGVFAYEALIRARHPQTQDVIGAWPLIDASVKLNLEHVLDQRARQTAIRAAAALRIKRDTSKLRLFINFMPNTIYDPEICLRTTMETAAECGMEISDLVFEVVETEHIPDMKRLHTILDYYRSRGAGTAVDDMGAGFSSLDYLTALRPDFVKLDRDLVIRAEQQAAARETLDRIIAQAKHLGIQVIAEGIETERQRQMCRAAGVDLMQGFLFARPANPPEAVAPTPQDSLHHLPRAA